MLITTNQLLTQWGTVFGDEVLAAAPRSLRDSFQDSPDSIWLPRLTCTEAGILA
jgi:hypothetical protein